MPSSTGELVGMVGSKKDPKRRIQPVKQSSGLKYRRAGGGVQEPSGHRARAMFALAVQEDEVWGNWLLSESRLFTALQKSVTDVPAQTRRL